MGTRTSRTAYETALRQQPSLNNWNPNPPVATKPTECGRCFSRAIVVKSGHAAFACSCSKCSYEIGDAPFFYRNGGSGKVAAFVSGLRAFWPTVKDGFRYLWDSINAERGFGWDANPWVWVVSFQKLEIAS